MHLTTRNVNTAFREMIGVFQRGTDAYDRLTVNIVRRPSRNGSVLMIDEPVTVTYTHPRERALFNAARDANPAFHLYEALWMLAGRNDVAPLAYYSKQMAEYSDDGKTLNGAYGYRWRQHRWVDYRNGVGDPYPEDTPWSTCDQLDTIVKHLKADPHSRRAVLQMWNVEDDLLKIGAVDNPEYLVETPHRFIKASKDVCCNLSVMFSLREVTVPCPTDPTLVVFRKALDMTVTNRSNDMVWGMLGANYVHFTILQEYMAARLGAEVGRYHHFSNNLHVYDEPDKAGIPKWKPDLWLNSEPSYRGDKYSPNDNWQPFPLVRDPAVFDREVKDFVEEFDGQREIPAGKWDEPFLNDVAAPLLMAFHRHKQRKADALEYAAEVKADDWRIACTNWLQRRAWHGS